MGLYSIQNKGVEGNIWKFFVISSTNKRAYMTFFSLFLLTLPNATAQTVGFISFLGQLFGFLFEVPSGYLSDTFGHKNALILGKLAIALGTLVLVFAQSVLFFAIAQVFTAFGFAMLSGTTATLFHETLRYLGRGDEYSKIMGKIRSASYVIPIIFIILLPIVAQHYGYRVAFALAFVIDFIGFLVTLFLTNVPQTEETLDNLVKKNIFVRWWQVGWLSYALFASFIFALFLGTTQGFKNPYQESLGFSVATLGVLWALSRVGIALLLLTNGYMKKYWSLKKVLLIQSLIIALSFVGVALAHNKWVVAILFIVSIVAMWGFETVKKHFFLEYIRNDRYKASLLSMNTFLNRIIAAGFSFLMGALVFHYGYRAGFLSFGVGLILLAILFSIVFFSSTEKKR